MHFMVDTSLCIFLLFVEQFCSIQIQYMLFDHYSAQCWHIHLPLFLSHGTRIRFAVCIYMIFLSYHFCKSALTFYIWETSEFISCHKWQYAASDRRHFFEMEIFLYGALNLNVATLNSHTQDRPLLSGVNCFSIFILKHRRETPISKHSLWSEQTAFQVRRLMKFGLHSGLIMPPWLWIKSCKLIII